ncbi:unnamed protein product [Eruca vesicaria subsp. sativa]|uniref:PWWP domain-containing protein n=1 Tax=Eruca vesicaria subsp. sativa TaxID=29727 RepID=A0ABC8L8T7_ERUVS|nr:unnamed protein product [Eruca vesicaria subsp. sativa]
MSTDSELEDVETKKGSEIENVSDAESEDLSQRSKLESLGSVVSSANEEKLKLCDSDLVWGKVRSYPWWPGQVFLDPSVASTKAKKYFKKKKGTFLIAYFGDFSFAWNHVSKIKPFHHHFSQMVNQSDSREFRNAVGCALEEVSRRVEFGLSCACVSEEAYDRVKTQNVVNPGVREESRVRYGGDKVSDAVFFEPVKLVEYMKRLACFPRYDESDKLLFVSNRAKLLAFQQWTSYLSFPRYENETFLKDMTDEKREEQTLSDFIADKRFGKSHSDKKRKVESLESSKPKKKIKNNRQREDSSVGNKVAEPCFAMRTIPLRTESEMDHALKPWGDSNSISKLEVENKKMKKPQLKELAPKKISPPDDMVASRKGTPQPLHLEHSNYEDFEKFIEEMSCSNLNHESDQASIPTDVKESSDKLILPENKDITDSGSKEEQTGVKDCSADSSAPNALILKFASSSSVPSEEKLHGIFNRYGPLREAETRVMKKGKKARVVFKRGEDAKTAFSSSGKYSIFGPSLLSYSLKYVGPKDKESNGRTH